MIHPSKTCELDTVFNLIKLGYTKKKIRKKLDIKASTLSNRLRRLVNLGKIELIGKYIIKVCPSSHFHPKVTTNQVHIKLNKRGHAFSIKVLFPNDKTPLNLKEKVIREYKNKRLKKLKFGSYQLKYKNNTIWINKKSLTIYSNNSYYSENALHSKFKAIKEIDSIIKYLKERYDIRGIYGIEVFREHYGLINNKLSQYILKQGGKLYVKDSGEKVTYWVDDSRKDDVGLKEFEGTDPIKINKADEYFKSHDRTNWEITPEKTIKEFNEIKQNQLDASLLFKQLADTINSIHNDVRRNTIKNESQDLEIEILKNNNDL